MARIPELKPQELSPKQYELAASLGRTRGGALSTNGPWGLLLRNAELCEAGGKFGTLLRDGTSVPKNLSELAILVTARLWTANFEWYAHAPQALNAGVSPDVVEAIRLRRRPAFTRRDEEAVYDYVEELYATRRVSDATYRRLLEHLDPQAAIELTTIAGFYTTIAMLLVAFEVDLPPGETPAFDGTA